jgi:heat shock protein HtpX
MALASALEKLEATNQRHPLAASPASAHLFIVNPLSGVSLAKLFSTHPPIEERVRRLRAMAGLRIDGRRSAPPCSETRMSEVENKREARTSPPSRARRFG